jgi:sterol 3beta-glucosyltransferase
VREAGLGPQPIPQKQLTVQNLSDAIHQTVDDHAMRQCAESVGEKIRAEDGTGNAVQIIQREMSERTGAAFKPQTV